MNAYDVFLRMKSCYQASGQVMDIDELVKEFPRLGILSTIGWEM